MAELATERSEHDGDGAVRVYGPRITGWLHLPVFKYRFATRTRAQL